MSTLPAVINTAGDITSVNGEQYATLIAANPVLADTLPSAFEGRGDCLQFIYNPGGDEEDLRLTLGSDGALVQLDLWQFDEDNTERTVGVNGEGGDWVDIEGGGLWEQLSIAVRGTNVAQQSALDKAVKLKGNAAEVVREGEDGDSVVTATWKPETDEDPTEETFELRLNEYGQIIGVAFSILTETDLEEGATEPEWYRATYLDGPWEELVEAGLETAAA